MEDWSGRKVFAEYASFRLEPESEYYKLRLGRYNGNAGDSFTWHNGKQFTTLDRDHDVYTGNKVPFGLLHNKLWLYTKDKTYSHFKSCQLLTYEAKTDKLMCQPTLIRTELKILTEILFTLNKGL